MGVQRVEEVGRRKGNFYLFDRAGFWGHWGRMATQGDQVKANQQYPAEVEVFLVLVHSNRMKSVFDLVWKRAQIKHKY